MHVQEHPNYTHMVYVHEHLNSIALHDSCSAGNVQ